MLSVRTLGKQRALCYNMEKKREAMTMRYVIGVLAGAIWGVLGAMFNQRILKRSLAAGRDRRVLEANLLRAAVDLVLLAAIVLLRGVLPFSYEMALAGTVSALGMMGIYYAFRTAAGADEKKPAPDTQEHTEE